MNGKASRAWSWRHAIITSHLPATTRHVLLTIACYMNELGSGCYPTTKQLAAATGLSQRAICEHIARASEGGWLTVTQVGFRGQKWRNNQYEAAWPDAEAADAGSAPSAAKVLTQDQQLPTEGADPNDKKVLTEGQSTSPVTTPSEREAREEDFEKAYRGWPTSTTDSRDEAWREWLGLNKIEREQAERDARRCVDTFKSIGRKHICSFATYLRERRWLGLPNESKPSFRSEEGGKQRPSPTPVWRPTAFMRANPAMFADHAQFVAWQARQAGAQ